MPLYEFRCDNPKCGRGETVLSSKVPERGQCPMCLEGMMKRAYSAPSVIIRRSAGEYAERAARGEETVPGLSKGATRSTVEQMARDRKRR